VPLEKRPGWIGSQSRKFSEWTHLKMSSGRPMPVSWRCWLRPKRGPGLTAVWIEFEALRHRAHARSQLLRQAVENREGIAAFSPMLRDHRRFPVPYARRPRLSISRASSLSSRGDPLSRLWVSFSRGRDEFRCRRRPANDQSIDGTYKQVEGAVSVRPRSPRRACALQL